MFRLYWNGQCLPRKNGRLAHVGMFKTFLVLLVLHGRGKYHLHYCFLNISTNLFLCFPMKRQKRYLGVSRIGGNVNSDHHLALLVGMPRNHRNTSETKSFALTSLFLMKSTKIPRNSSFDTNSWLPNVIKKLGWASSSVQPVFFSWQISRICIWDVFCAYFFISGRRGAQIKTKPKRLLWGFFPLLNEKTRRMKFWKAKIFHQTQTWQMPSFGIVEQKCLLSCLFFSHAKKCLFQKFVVLDNNWDYRVQVCCLPELFDLRWVLQNAWHM